MTAKIQKQIQFILMDEAINQIHDDHTIDKVTIESAMVTHTVTVGIG